MAQRLRELIYELYGRYVRGYSGEKLKDFVETLSQHPGAWGGVLREDERTWERDDACTYCGREEGVEPWPVIPLKRAMGIPRLATILGGEENRVPTCRACRRNLGDRDVLEWHAALEDVPKRAMFAFLRTVYEVHLTQGTLEARDPNMDGVLDVYDLSVVLTRFILRRGKKGAKHRETRHDPEEG